MAVDRDLWKKALIGSYAAPWPCPSCPDGKMQVQRDTFHFEETAESRRSHSDDDFHQLNVAFVFSAILQCNRCKEKVSCCGDGGYQQEERWDEEGEVTIDYMPIYFVRYFSTSMRIFVPSNKVPSSVRNSLYKSFLVFFCDIGAAANHVRQCVEEILTHAGIPTKNDKGEFVTLGRRIELFKAIDEENAHRLNALRWIGNFGSHPETLTKDDVFDAYDILEIVLEDRYVGHQRSVRDRVDQINKAKKPGPGRMTRRP
jgi:hypothetical protein